MSAIPSDIYLFKVNSGNKSTTETPEQCVRYVQIQNKNTRHHWYSSGVSIIIKLGHISHVVDIEQFNASKVIPTVMW